MLRYNTLQTQTEKPEQKYETEQHHIGCVEIDASTKIKPSTTEKKGD